MMKCFTSDFDIPCSIFVPPGIGFRVRLRSRIDSSVVMHARRARFRISRKGAKTQRPELNFTSSRLCVSLCLVAVLPL